MGYNYMYMFSQRFNSGDYKLSVSTKELYEKADKMRSVCVDIEARLKNIIKCVDSSAYCWEGSAADTVRKLFYSEKSDLDLCTEKINAQINKLNLIASLYEKAEQKSSENAEALPDSIID